MSKPGCVRKHIVEKNTTRREQNLKTNQNFLSKHLKRIYPIGIHKSSSSLSLSSLSLSLSQNSDSSLTADSAATLEQKISLALHLIGPHEERKYLLPKHVQPQQQHQTEDLSGEELRRCNWITKNSGKHFHLALKLLLFLFYAFTHTWYINSTRRYMYTYGNMSR